MWPTTKRKTCNDNYKATATAIASSVFAVLIGHPHSSHLPIVKMTTTRMTPLLYRQHRLLSLRHQITATCHKNGRYLATTSSPPPPTVGTITSRSQAAKVSQQLKQAKEQQKLRQKILEKKQGKENEGKWLFLRAGLPFVLFSLGAFWVVQTAIDGKLKEKAASRREVSQSERQMYMEEEHDDMMQRLNKAAKTDFDNTKRIERPEDILARRRAEREKRNVWYRRAWRKITGE